MIVFLLPFAIPLRNYCYCYYLLLLLLFAPFIKHICAGADLGGLLLARRGNVLTPPSLPLK